MLPRINVNNTSDYQLLLDENKDKLEQIATRVLNLAFFVEVFFMQEVRSYNNVQNDENNPVSEENNVQLQKSATTLSSFF